MLMVPASKVSVPLAVVIRTRSRAPDSVTSPPTYETEEVPFLNDPDTTQAFDPRVVSMTAPEVVLDADAAPPIANPDVSLPEPGVDPFIVPKVEIYPVV
jgi:hypothetical protein